MHIIMQQCVCCVKMHHCSPTARWRLYFFCGILRDVQPASSKMAVGGKSKTTVPRGVWGVTAPRRCVSGGRPHPRRAPESTSKLAEVGSKTTGPRGGGGGRQPRAADGLGGSSPPGEHVPS